MKCKNLMCDNDVAGRSAYCSSKCRVAYSRFKGTVTKTVTTNNQNSGRSVTVVAESVTAPESVTCSSESVTLEHYYSNPEIYATRTNPEKLNWGEPMSWEDMALAKLVGNRVGIPGDWDYEGVCVEVDGAWKVAG